MKVRVKILLVLMILSVFLLSGSALGQDTPTISLSDATVDAGSDTSTNLTTDTLPNGLQTYNVTVEINDGSVADIDGASGNAITLQIVSQSSNSITFRAADLTRAIEDGANEVNLATIDFANTQEGTTDVTVSVHTFQNDNGSAINPDTDPGTLTVTEDSDSGGEGGGGDDQSATPTERKATPTATPAERTATPTATPAERTATPTATPPKRTPTPTPMSTEGAATPTATPTATPVERTATPTAAGTLIVETPEEESPTMTPTATPGSDGPGFGVVSACLAVLLVIGYWQYITQ